MMRMMRNTAPLAFALTAAPFLLGGAARAQATQTANAVFVGGTPIARVRVAAGGYTPEQRATAIQARLNRILASGPIHVDDITVEKLGSVATVRVKGELLLTADSATAKFNAATPLELANQWAGHLRDVLPGLTKEK